jgi:hypothetical protein
METTPNANPGAPPPVTAPPLAPAAKPPSKLYRILSGIIGLVAIIIGGSQLYNVFHVTLPDCDSQRAKDTLSGIFKEHKYEPTGYTSIKTVSTNENEVVCNAVLPLPDGANLVADYSFYWEDKSPKIKYSMFRKAP